MSSKLKHRERSHKTRNNNYSVFNSFKRTAWTKEDTKATRVSVIDRFKALFRKNQSK